MVGSRCPVEDCSTDVAVFAEFQARIHDGSAGRTRSIVENCLAANSKSRIVVINAHLSAGRSRGVVEDYLACFTSYEVLQNAVIVDDTGAANNQFAPGARVTRRDV